MNNIYAILWAVILAVLLTTANILLKMISAANADSGLDMYLASPVKLLVAIALYFLVFLAYPYLLRFYPMNIIFPSYTGLTVLLVAASGAVFFGEKMGPSQLVGVALLVAGIVCITLNSSPR